MNISMSVNNQFVTKYWNQRLILNLIKENDGISRTDISKQLGLSLPSVSKNVDLLIKKGLVYEAGLDKSNGGRNPIAIKYDHDFSTVLAISLHTNVMTINILNLNGKELYNQKVVDFFDQYPPHELVDLICEHVTAAMATFERIGCIAISIPGIIENNQIKLSYPFYQLKGYHLKNMLEEKLAIDVVMRNDINAKAIGEYAASTTPVDSLVYISLEDKGIGSGIVINGEIYEGHSFGAGEIGSLIFDLQNVSGSSKMESIESKLFQGEFFQFIKEHQSNQNHSSTFIIENRYIDFSKLHEAMKRDQALASYVYNYLSKYTALITYNIHKILNTQRIVLGGFFSVFGEELLERTNECLIEISDVEIWITLADAQFNSEAHGLMVYGANHLEQKLLER